MCHESNECMLCLYLELASHPVCKHFCNSEIKRAKMFTPWKDAKRNKEEK